MRITITALIKINNHLFLSLIYLQIDKQEFIDRKLIKKVLFYESYQASRVILFNLRDVLLDNTIDQGSHTLKKPRTFSIRRFFYDVIFKYKYFKLRIQTIREFAFL